MGLKQSALAKMAGVSRACVTKWFHNKGSGEKINIETNTLFKLAENLKMSPEFFLIPLPDLSSLETPLLWDKLYPTMIHFAVALAKYEWPAVSRLVQAEGFHVAQKILGKKTIADFPKYAKYIKPARRKQLEILWPLYHSKT